MTIDDSDRILSWRNDPSVSRYMYSDHQITKAEHSSWLDRLVHQDDRLGWIIVVDDVDSGLVLITEIDHTHKNAMWAFYVADPAARGKGVGGAVEAFILTYAFEVLDLHKLSLEVLDFNESVIAMHRRFGFREEGIFREDKLKDGNWHDVHRLAFLVGDWPAASEEITKRLPHPVVP